MMWRGEWITYHIYAGSQNNCRIDYMRGFRNTGPICFSIQIKYPNIAVFLNPSIMNERTGSCRKNRNTKWYYQFVFMNCDRTLSTEIGLITGRRRERLEIDSINISISRDEWIEMLSHTRLEDDRDRLEDWQRVESIHCL